MEEATASPTALSTNGSDHNIESVCSSSKNNHQQTISVTNNSSRNCTPKQNDCYVDNCVVWVRLGQSWWPGSVVALERCPQDFLCDLKKTPLAVVKFFEENGFVDIHKQDHIYPYNCERKKEFIKKGLNLRSVQNKEELFKKFESDVLMAQKLTGGSQEVFTQIEEDSNKRRIDYSNLGFGPPKPKKKKEDAPRGLGSDISEAVRYKKDGQGGFSGSDRQMTLQHKVVIMEQPHVENMKEDLNKSCNSYTCYTCGFTCSRLGVIVWHNKGHIKTVMDYDTGIKRKRPIKRKPKALKANSKGKKIEKGAVDHSKSNGHVEQDGTNSLQARELLMDWDDDENEVEANSPEASPPHLNNGHAEGLGPNSAGVDQNNDAEEFSNRPQTDRSSRRPMRAAEDLNSAFDALLADTPNSSSLPSLPQHNSYSNNQSDSETSDWEKYYAKNSDDYEDDEENEGDGVKESDIKSLCEGSDLDESSVPNGNMKSSQTNGAGEETSGSMSGADADDEPSRDSFSADANNQGNNADAAADEEEEEEEEEEESLAKDTEGSSSTTSSSPSNSGPAFMLVAVDAQGNNVPMPALTDRNHSSNLVAVEASMEDGTSRTLYIDPAYLEPNVDLSNLMLHIDNSGQETVIIPSTTSQDTVSSSTPPRDSSGPAARPLPGIEGPSTTDRLVPAQGSTATTLNTSQPPSNAAGPLNPLLDPTAPSSSPRQEDSPTSAGSDGASAKESQPLKEQASEHQSADGQYSSLDGAGPSSPRR